MGISCCLSAMLSGPANLENSAVGTRLEKIRFHSNPKEEQCQRMFKLLYSCPHFTLGSPGASVVKNLPAMQKTRIRSLGREDPLEKEVTTHSGILGCGIPWTEEAGRLQSVRWQKLDMTEHACIFPLLGSWPSRF